MWLPLKAVLRQLFCLYFSYQVFGPVKEIIVEITKVVFDSFGRRQSFMAGFPRGCDQSKIVSLHWVNARIELQECLIIEVVVTIV